MKGSTCEFDVGRKTHLPGRRREKHLCVFYGSVLAAYTPVFFFIFILLHSPLLWHTEVYTHIQTVTCHSPSVGWLGWVGFYRWSLLQPGRKQQKKNFTPKKVSNLLQQILSDTISSCFSLYKKVSTFLVESIYCMLKQLRIIIIIN